MPKPCQSRTLPRTGPRLVTPHPLPAAAASSSVGLRRGAAAPPTLGPTRARPLPRALGTALAPCPPFAAQAACRPRSLVPLAWRSFFSSPGPPNLGSPPSPAYIQPCLLEDPPNPLAPCSDPAVPAHDSSLASS